MRELNIKWVGETSIKIAEDDELLKLAAESGLKYLVAGIETPSSKALKSIGKGFFDVSKVKEYIGKLHDYGVIVDSVMIFGFDDHDKNIFKETLDFVHRIDLDMAWPAILIPYPGTPIFEKFEKEGRILTKDWSKYDGNHVVFKPKLMSPEELEEGVKWFADHYYGSLGYLWKTVKRYRRLVF
ncbi:MAG: hypothetical protein PWQ40_61 [Archaeoglobus sp.]|nr:hypothetical protein [Archaeoglobus sp.]